MRIPILAIRVQLLLGWNIYLIFNTDIVNLVWKIDEGEAESIILLIFVLWRCLNRRWSWNCIFFQSGFSRSNKHDTFWQAVSTGYFYVLFLWVIAVSDFLSLEINENVGLLLSVITFTINSHANNHFYKYNYLFQIL